MKRSTFALAAALALASAAPVAASALSNATLPGTAAPAALFAADDIQVLRVKDDKDKGDKAAKKQAKKAEKAAKKQSKDVEKTVRKQVKEAQKAEKKQLKAVEKADKEQEKRVEKALKDETKAIKKAAKSDRKANKEYRKLLEEARASDRYARRDVRTVTERETQTRAILQAAAPQSRDMTALISAGALALLGNQVAYAEVDDDQLLTYRNCPPGLAKKDPPCVPPGLAAQGVTYEDWVSYDQEELDRLYIERRRTYLDDLDDAALTDGDTTVVDVPPRVVTLDGTPVPGEDRLLLTSEQIAELYDLRPAPAGFRYALIDGLPVQLNEEDYTSLLRINDLALSAQVAEGVTVAPTAALTQDELRRTYRLPESEAGYKYTVLNGELIQLEDQAFETLQLIRIARAVL